MECNTFHIVESIFQFKCQIMLISIFKNFSQINIDTIVLLYLLCSCTNICLIPWSHYWCDVWAWTFFWYHGDIDSLTQKICVRKFLAPWSVTLSLVSVKTITDIEIVSEKAIFLLVFVLCLTMYNSRNSLKPKFKLETRLRARNHNSTMQALGLRWVRFISYTTRKMVFTDTCVLTLYLKVSVYIYIFGSFSAFNRYVSLITNTEVSIALVIAINDA